MAQRRNCELWDEPQPVDPRILRGNLRRLPWASVCSISPLVQALLGLDKLSLAMAENLSRVRMAS